MAIYPRIVSREPGTAIVRIVLRDPHCFLAADFFSSLVCGKRHRKEVKDIS